ncbi:unnamed protein product [Prorocentrum cordatum]|uniref:Sugar phosphate transporter domain-containing protein n=1 Tax=Prorocentrum cordatum TaxID=2364126 RepID=A0ABN9TA52_9DINO|nr:unnamed protein product [Polarella glacialis]
MIFMNNAILQHLPNPATLTAWHMAVSSVLVRVLPFVTPASFALFRADAPLVDARTLLMKLGPISMLFALSLAMSNRTYMHCSVAFIQMMKSSHSVITYMMSVALAMQSFSWCRFQAVCAVWFGVLLAVTGELEFSIIGFACQCTSSVAECGRVVLIEMLINRKGMRMDPLTALSYYAPLCFFLLVPFAASTEMPDDMSAWWRRFEENVGFIGICLNGMLAFSLNISVVLLLQKTSAVTYILCGVMKDILIIVGSVFFRGTTISLQQVIGYTVAVASVQVFNQVGKNPDIFDERGIIGGLRCILGWKVAAASGGASKRDE